MKEELLKRLDVLAAKVGVASEHMWGVLVRQAYIEGISVLVATLLVAIGSVFIWRQFVKSNGAYDDLDVLWLIAGTISTIIGIVFLVISVDLVPTAIFNPEYYALKQILTVLR